MPSETLLCDDFSDNISELPTPVKTLLRKDAQDFKSNETHVLWDPWFK